MVFWTKRMVISECKRKGRTATMIKLGIVGSDNSHADAFSQLCNLDKGFNGFKCRGAKVVAIYGHDPKRTEEVARNGQIPTIVEKADHMIGIVDAVLVGFRDRKST